MELVNQRLTTVVASVIAYFAEQLQADVIVLATHGKTGAEAFRAGTVTHNVCSRCNPPLLLVPVAGPTRS